MSNAIQYVVILGTPDSELSQEDFVVHGPFDSKEAAQKWVDAINDLGPADPLDHPTISRLEHPNIMLSELRDAIS